MGVSNYVMTKNRKIRS